MSLSRKSIFLFIYFIVDVAWAILLIGCMLGWLIDIVEGRRLLFELAFEVVAHQRVRYFATSARRSSQLCRIIFWFVSIFIYSAQLSHIDS